MNGKANTRECCPITQQILPRILLLFDVTSFWRITMHVSFCLALWHFYKSANLYGHKQIAVQASNSGTLQEALYCYTPTICSFHYPRLRPIRFAQTLSLL